MPKTDNESVIWVWLIVFYLQVFFWEYQRKNETEKLRTLFLPEGGVKLKNLTGYTTYMISVAAFNAAGDGPRSPPTRGRTQQAGEETLESSVLTCLVLRSLYKTLRRFHPKSVRTHKS